MTDEVISKLLEAERRAKSIVGEAEKRKEHIDDEIRTETEEMNKQYSQRAQKRIEKVASFEENSANEKLESLRKNTDEALKKLDAEYEKNKQQWLEELYKKAIG